MDKMNTLPSTTLRATQDHGGSYCGRPLGPVGHNYVVRSSLHLSIASIYIRLITCSVFPSTRSVMYWQEYILLLVDTCTEVYITPQIQTLILLCSGPTLLLTYSQCIGLYTLSVEEISSASSMGAISVYIYTCIISNCSFHIRTHLFPCINAAMLL